MLYLIILALVVGFFAYRGFCQLINRPNVNISRPTFNYVFGAPGSGKSSYLAYIASICVKKHIPIYCNIDLMGIEYKKISVSDIGKKFISDGVLLIDESSIEFNNRDYKSMTKEAIRYFKKHRHYNVTIYIFSQSYEDTDITLRRLCQRYYYIAKSKLYFLNKKILVKRIKKIVQIDDLTKQIIDGYSFVPLSTYRFKQKSVRKFFNSFDRDLPLTSFDEIENKGVIKI